MERNEMIEVLMEKVNVTCEEAKEALENCNWDLLEAIIYLERKGKANKEESTAIIEVSVEKDDNKEESKKHQEKFGGLGEILGRIFKCLGKIIKKGNENYFEIKKDSEKPVRISLTISVLLVVLLTIPSIILLIVGLFCGYKYSICGENANYDGVNSVFEEVSKSADSIKKDFKEGYDK